MTVAAVASVVGTGVATVGAYQQSQAAKSQANYQAAVARNNAIIAQQNAADARDRGKAAEEEHRDRIAQAKGSVTAGAAAAGFLVDDPGSTNVDLLADVAEAGELDIQKIRDNTEREAHRALVQGVNFTAQAGLFDAQASAQSPMMAAGGTFLSGAAQSATAISKV